MAARAPGQMKRAFFFGLGLATGAILVPLAIVEIINWKLR